MKTLKCSVSCSPRYAKGGVRKFRTFKTVAPSMYSCRFTKAQSAHFPQYESAKKLLRKRNSDLYIEPQQQFTKPQTGLYTIRAMYSILLLSFASSDSKMSIISENSNNADDTGNRRQQIHLHGISQQSGVLRSGWCCLSVVVLSDEVGKTFANEILSTLLADDRCRQTEDYIDFADFIQTAPDLSFIPI